MSKGLAIAALIMSVIGFAIPLVTVIWVWVTFVLVAISFYLGDDGKAFGIAAIVVSLVNLFLLTPSFWLQNSESSSIGFITFILAVLPFAVRELKEKVLGETEE